MNSDALNMDRFTRPTTDAPHELAGAVNLIQKAGLVTETYDYPYWLKKVHEAHYDHPEDEIKRLLRRAAELKDYFRTKGEPFSMGGWLTNQLKEQAKGPQPRV
jgi:hypothetical protein